MVLLLLDTETYDSKILNVLRFDNCVGLVFGNVNQCYPKRACDNITPHVTVSTYRVRVGESVLVIFIIC